MASFNSGYRKAFFGEEIKNTQEHKKASHDLERANLAWIIAGYSLVNPLLLLSFLVYSAEAKWNNKFMRSVSIGYDFLIGNLPKLTAFSLNLALTEFKRKNLSGALRGVLAISSALLTSALTYGSILLGIGLSPLVSMVSAVAMKVPSLVSVASTVISAITIPGLITVANTISSFFVGLGFQMSAFFAKDRSPQSSSIVTVNPACLEPVLAPVQVAHREPGEILNLDGHNADSSSKTSPKANQAVNQPVKQSAEIALGSFNTVSLVGQGITDERAPSSSEVNTDSSALNTASNQNAATDGVNSGSDSGSGSDSDFDGAGFY